MYMYTYIHIYKHIIAYILLVRMIDIISRIDRYIHVEIMSDNLQSLFVPPPPVSPVVNLAQPHRPPPEPI